MYNKAIIKENELLKKQISELQIIINNIDFYDYKNDLSLCDNFYSFVQQVKELNVKLDKLNQEYVNLNSQINDSFFLKLILKIKNGEKNEK